MDGVGPRSVSDGSESSGEEILKALYTDGDRRRNLYEVEVADEVKEQARSVGCMMASRNLIEVGDGSYKLRRVPKLGERYKLSDQAAFYHEPVAAYGTLFLVGEDLALTAAHNVCKSKSDQLDDAAIKDTRIVFDFKMLEEKKSKHVFEADTVYTIKKVVAHKFDSAQNRSIDWALIKLDRRGRAPLPVDFIKPVAPGTGVDVLGHPSGAPQKYAFGAQIQKTNHPDYYEADLDAFCGNSGSPVFDAASRQVTGILVSGQNDYEAVVVEDQLCMQPHHVTDGEIQRGGYEKCQRVQTIDSTFQLYIGARNGDPDLQYQLGLDYVQQGITKKALSWLQKAAYSGHVAAQNKFNELSEFQLVDIENPSPPHRRAEKGLNLGAICESPQCNGEVVYFQKKIGSFDMGRATDDLQCPSCSQAIIKVEKAVFLDCQFTINGKSTGGAVDGKDKVSHQKYKTFGIDRPWRYLNITTS